MKRNNWTNFRIFIAVLSLLALLFSILGVFSSLVNPVEITFFYYFGLVLTVTLCADLIFLIIWICLRNWQLAAVMLCAILMNYYFIGNMFRLSFEESSVPKDLRVISYNVHSFYGARMERAYGVGRMVTEEDPDILCFQEYAKGNDTLISGLFKQLPYYEQRGEFAVFSKFPITFTDVVLFDDSKFGFMITDIDFYGNPIRVISAHLQTTGVNTSFSQYKQHGSVALAWAGSSFNYLIQYRSMQMEQLKATVDTASIPLVLCADLNDTPASYGYRELRKSLHDDFQSCGKGYASTYLGIIGLMRIDYVMYDDNFKALRRKAIKLKNSDHRPVILDLKYLPDVF